MMQEIRRQVFSLFLKISKLWRTKRVQNFIHDVNGEIDKIGLVPSQSDRELENPSEKIPQQPNCLDGVCFNGFNSKGECLIIRLARRYEDRVEVTVFLKLCNGSKYELPLLPDTRAYAYDAQNFSSNGLKIQCLSAMYRWRIAYNGLLRRVQDNSEETPEIVHVKFSFTWTLVNLAYDFQTDFSCDLLAEALSKDYSFFPYSALGSLKDRQDCYEQWGQIAGTVSVNGQDEKEKYFWGPRTRNRGIMDWNEIEEYLSICGQMNDGTRFHLGAVSISGLVSKLNYGYIILPDHFVRPIDSCQLEIASEIVFTAGGEEYKICYTQSMDDGFDAYRGDKWNIASRLRLAKFNLNEFEGSGFIETGVRNTTEKPPNILKVRPCFLREPEIEDLQIPLVVAFQDTLCQSSKVSGGKGSSLAMLMTLFATRQNKNERDSDNFAVPQGFVITTAAYRHHLAVNQDLALEISSYSSNGTFKDVEQASKMLTSAFLNTHLSDKLKAAVLEKTQKVFPEGLPKKGFAVRSSASGEDSSETSAAGQMDTFLGIRTIEQIYENVVKCWSSQFSVTAINYKRQTGQIVDTDMAVVIQEMVPAEIAGVVFTCDPLTCNPENVTITANYGLGESVVSASAEPDTIILKRSLDNRLVFHSESIGRKDIKVQISNKGGTSSENCLDEDSKKCCLKKEDSLNIGRVAVMIEQCFGNPRDIEWAIADDKLCLLQARPITTCDLETQFEIVHELDAGILNEFEYLTKGNVGEVMPGALCPLSLSTLNTLVDIAFQHACLLKYGPSRCVYHPVYPGLVYRYAGHTFLYVIDIMLREVNEKDDSSSDGWQWSIFGRIVEESANLKKIALHRYGEFPAFQGIKNLIKTLIKSFFYGRKLEDIRKTVMGSYLPEDMKFSSSNQLYTIISQMLPKHCKVFKAHADCCGFSSLYNMLILGIMASRTGAVDERLFAMFSKLLSSCENVESADVPQSMKKLADTIVSSGEKEKLLKMTPEEATKWLEEEEGQVGAKYREFLRQHGHRCLMEYDLYRAPWNANAVPLVNSLQSMVKQPNIQTTNKSKDDSPDSVLNALSLNFGLKLVLKMLVRWAGYAVGGREQSKSVLVRSGDIYRKAYRRLGQMMLDEGRIPELDLIFFFTHEEIGELLKTRSARLVSKAIRRKRTHLKLNALRFPDICSGPPQPIKEPNITFEDGVSEWLIKGTTVSQGEVVAPARVVTAFDEAHKIQPGEILVTYSTDIGWTPYFPVLSGVVTELGGLGSHGAVIAREYGLPCIVGAVNATYIVKTGDLVMLDGKNGTLKQVSETERN